MKNKAITWEELADDYKKHTGRPAKILPMDQVFKWGKKQKHLYKYNKKKGTLHRI